MRTFSHYTICLLMTALPCILAMGCSSGNNPDGPDTFATEVEGPWVGYNNDDTTTYFFSFNKNNYAINISSPSGNVLEFAGTFVMDSATNPRHLDAYIGQSREASYAGKTSLGIYKVVVDTLWWSANEPGLTGHPASFVPPDTGNTAMHWVAVRQ